MEQGHSQNEDAATGEPGQAQSGTAGGFATRIRAGMEVVSDEGSYIGTVAGVEGDEILLAREASSGEGREYVPLSLVAAVDGNRIITRARGDNSFGEEASH